VINPETQKKLDELCAKLDAAVEIRADRWYRIGGGWALPGAMLLQLANEKWKEDFADWNDGRPNFIEEPDHLEELQEQLEQHK
jgi:hypothetical protein